MLNSIDIAYEKAVFLFNSNKTIDFIYRSRKRLRQFHSYNKDPDLRGKHQELLEQTRNYFIRFAEILKLTEYFPELFVNNKSYLSVRNIHEKKKVFALRRKREVILIAVASIAFTAGFLVRRYSI
jgi:hypothetical protein